MTASTRGELAGGGERCRASRDPYLTSGWLVYEWGGPALIAARSRKKIDLSSVIYDYQKRLMVNRARLARFAGGVARPFYGGLYAEVVKAGLRYAGSPIDC